MDEKDLLREAEGVDLVAATKSQVAATLEDPKFKNVNSDDWNTLYLEYTDNKTPAYEVVIVKKLFMKNEPAEGDGKSGYVKYEGATGQAQQRKLIFFKQNVSTIDSGKLELVDNEEDASFFTPEDAQVMVNAIKRNKDFNLKQAIVTTKKISGKTADESSVLFIILSEYFKLLCGDNSDGPVNFIRGGVRVINNICRRRKAPLVGNPLLDALANAYKVTQVRNSFKVTDNSMTILANLLATNVTTVSSLNKLDTFKAVIIFNNNLYRYDADDISKLFNYFDQAKRISAANIGIEELKGLAGLKLAKHLLLDQGTGDEPDRFSCLVFGTDPGETPAIIEDLGKTVTDNDGILLKGYIRSVAQVKNLLDRLSEDSEDETANDHFYLQITRGGTLDVKQAANENVGSEEAAAIFNKINFKKDDTIKLVYAQYANKENERLPDLINVRLLTSDDLSDKFEFKDGKVTLLKDISTGLSIKLLVSGSTFEMSEFKLTDDVPSTDTTPTPGTEAGETEETSTEGETAEETTTPPIEGTTTEVAPEEATSMDKAGLIETTPVGRQDGEVLRDVEVEVGDIVTGLDGKEYKVTPETIGDGTWDIKFGTKQYIKPIDLNRLSTGKSIGDLITLNRANFQNEFRKLNRREKKVVRGRVNPNFFNGYSE